MYKAGKVQTRSGDWEWLVMEVFSLPEWVVVHRRLHFQDPGNRFNEMFLPLATDWDDFSEDGIRQLSLEPAERRFQDSAGAVWWCYPSDRPTGPGKVPDRSVLLHGSEGGQRSVRLPDGRTLGDLTQEEINALIKV